MDRKALVLYLENVRDLEAAKALLKRKFADNRRDYKDIQSRLHLQPQYETYDEESSMEFFIGSGGFGVIALGAWIGSRILGGGFPETVVSMLLGGMCFVFAGAAVACLVGGITKYLKNGERKDAVAAHNAQEDRRVPFDREMYRRNEQQWKAYEKSVCTEKRKLQKILNGFYAENLIPEEHRGKLADIEYLYELAGSAQLSYSQILLHGKLEEDIRRVEGGLDEVLAGVGKELYRTRCVHGGNRRSVQKIADRNDRMLGSLQRAALNADEAALYSRIAANYNRACTWLAGANYLKVCC